MLKWYTQGLGLGTFIAYCHLKEELKLWLPSEGRGAVTQVRGNLTDEDMRDALATGNQNCLVAYMAYAPILGYFTNQTCGRSTHLPIGKTYVYRYPPAGPLISIITLDIDIPPPGPWVTINDIIVFNYHIQLPTLGGSHVQSYPKFRWL